MTDEKLTFQEGMTDISDWHIQRNMRRYAASQDARHLIKTPWQLAATHNKQLKRVIVRNNGVIVSDKVGVAKARTVRYKHGS